MPTDPATGVYIYDGTEPDYPMQDTLNLLANSTRAAVAAVRTGDYLMTTINPTAFVTLNSGWGWRAGYANVVRRLADRIEFTLAFTKTAGYAHGEYPATIAQSFAPVGTSEWPLTGVQSGGVSGTPAASATAAAIGSVVDANRRIVALTPTTGRQHLQVSGYFVMV